MGSNGLTRQELLIKLNMPQFWENGWGELTELVHKSSGEMIKHFLTFPENVRDDYVDRIEEHFNDTDIVSKHKKLVTSGRYEVDYSIAFPKVQKHGEKRFYKNEKDYVTTDFFQYSGQVKFISVQQWDANVVTIPLQVN